ncbi:sodium ion-translocating decarboxylase subunit beta [Tetragenococcus koreensis]|uniref:Glutaconyl-CoA decarboxylase subunit beta n=2 Tax=Tetragenococcus TaxID=51668 RepID=A0AA37XJV4_9ENTE|nr:MULTISPECIES: sodium ion-translocating decarboxylase subunit beta [Tetragenococcus]MDN6277522.1 sodium ion-translocating decarboxylase subunit beta [Lactococcus lactis]MDN6750327.1 sodium ion-translocating decarboxylase subunit beta [Staphylococcus equorum]GMA54310.1 putative methylmalonyl-CoA decarboxylase, beta-subunit [Alicyclobacillus contaminans]AYW44865.1 glutaconyl-CoA decarboxylase subunit beta [Tetragenococcus koreensis]AYW48445.1 glutaconyl-CoA decarboxylase subunit beta [Tetragen
MFDVVNELVQNSGILSMTYKELIMIIVSLIFLYLAVRKGYEPYLLIPIAFGILLVNLPLGGVMDAPSNGESGGLLYYLYQGVDLGIYPPLIFLCLGASTDFGPLLANPKTLLLGAAAQFGIFSAFFLAIVAGMSPEEAASIGIIGGADGPTAIYLTSQLADHILPAIALAAYSYMALVPIIQPPLMRLLTTEKERKVKMEQLRTVSKKEKILFPIVTTLFVTLIIPSATTLVGMLMLGNLIRESGQVPKLSETLQNSFMYIVTILLGVSVGAKATGETFLTLNTLIITVLGLIAFAVGTASGLLLGKLMYKMTNGQINPLIGAAGVSAVPMAARVVQKEGIKYNPSNYLLMHAMSPNVAGVVGSAVTAGVLLSFFG